MSVLLKEEGGLQLARHGAAYFIIYSTQEHPNQRRHLKISEEESNRIMEGTPIEEIFLAYSGTIKA